MKRDDIFPSKYLKAADLKGKPIAVTIESAPTETLKNTEGKEQRKTVLYFAGAKKFCRSTGPTGTAARTFAATIPTTGQAIGSSFTPIRRRWEASP